MKTVGSVVTSLILVMALGGGGLLHAIVPHSHGDDHGSGQNHESAVWTGLHGALSHEQKKFLLAIVATIAIVTLGIILNTFSAFRVSMAYLRAVSSLARVRDPNAGELLRRGIHPYRKFG